MEDEQLETAAQQAQEAASAAQEAATAAQVSADAALDAAAAATGLSEALSASLGGGPISEFVFLFTIFVLAIFVGYYVVWSVTPALHTPLMSVTNAISSVIVVGALIAVGVDAAGAADAANAGWARGLGFIAVILASINIFGGFMVTNRMLAMYKKKER
ncbi:MAG: proton-translocating transhydrogenase family protein [Pseudomonadota bacterium]